MPAIGVSRSSDASRATPYTSLEERISGIIERGTPKSARMSSRHSSVFRSMKSVREALVTSVACTPPSGPPVRFQSTHESVVPKMRSPASARSRAPSTFSRIQAILVPEKYVARGSPTMSLYFSTPSSPASRSTIGWVRVSCQTIALYTGMPVFLSQTTAVSRWLVMPIAAMS